MNNPQFDLIIFTFAPGLDGTNAMNQVRIPLYQSWARQLQKHGRVLVVTHWFSLVPDVFRFPDRLFKPRCSKMGENLFVYAPVVPFGLGAVERYPFLRRRMCYWLGRQVRMAMRQIGTQNPIRVVMVNDPFHHHLLGLVGESLAVYDCLDEYSLYGGAPEPVAEVLAHERRLVQQVDLVFVTSRALYDKMQEQHSNVHYFPNAVDFDFFYQATQTDTPVAPALSKIPHPIIGFMGNLTHWYDFTLLRAVIQARRDWSFVFIGWVSPYPSCADDIQAIQSLSNVYFLGRQEFEALPSFLKGFDVAIMPYETSRAGPTVNPDKMYQYFAAGIPQVATPTPDIVQYGEVISLADNPKDFVRLLEQRLAAGREDERIKQGIAIARDNTWDRRTKGMLEVITAHLRAKIEGRVS